MGFGYACTLVGASLGNYNSSIVQNAVIECARRLQSREDGSHHSEIDGSK